MFCQECLKVKTCKKVCKELQEYLSNEKIYSADYIRPRTTGGGSWREIPMGNSSDLEHIASHRAFDLKFGKKHFKNKED